MKKYLKQGWQLFQDTLSFFKKGVKENLLKEYVKAFFVMISPHLGKFHYQIQEMSVNHQEQLLILHQKAKGLHTLLPNPSLFYYSILIELTNPSANLLKSCLSSICLQTAPHFEILLGSKIALTNEIFQLIQQIKQLYPDCLRIFDFSHCQTSESTYNLLAKESKGNFLLFLEQEDWVRPDLLYRYEQFLRTVSYLEKAVVNCYEGYINENDAFLPRPILKKTPIKFPYFFHRPFDLKGILVSKILWNEVTGIRQEFSGAEVEDFFLRLDLAEAIFATIPLPLYFCRITSPKSYPKNNHLEAFIQALKGYSKAKGLDWSFTSGYRQDSLRAIPQNIPPHKIQIIVPFKDQKDMTMRCLDCLMKQKGVNFKITAIDNGSSDDSIGEAIKNLGGEVLRVEEPFNYSRLNNMAVTQTKQAQDCDLLLFLNNDVELEEQALWEMTRWIDQPSIGMVGARLHYPNGLLQHGGIFLENYHMPESLWWKHREKLSYFDQMEQTKSYLIADAVTTACALIKKEIFVEVGGFDEICYPIAYSDTNLAAKLSKRGLECFYTPYASGIHHESLSRKLSLEDFDSSRWLHEMALNSFRS